MAKVVSKANGWKWDGIMWCKGNARISGTKSSDGSGLYWGFVHGTGKLYPRFANREDLGRALEADL